MPVARWAGRLFAGWSLVALQLRLSEGKVQVGSVSIGGIEEENRWRYMSKFGFGFGVGEYDVRLRLKEPSALPTDVQLDLDVYLDEDWHRVESLPACQRASDSLSRRSFRVPLASSGTWGEWQMGAVEHRVRPHIWYFALSGCRGQGPSSPLEVEFEFRARQEGGSEFSVEDGHMPAAQALVVLCLVVLLVWSVPGCRRLRRGAGLHPVVLALAVAVALQCVAQALYAAHLVRYSSDGVGLQRLCALAEGLSLASQAVQAALVLAIARGYTLLPAAGGLGLTRPVAAIAMLAHSALASFGKLQDDDPNRHHDHEGALGLVIVVARLAIFAWFLCAVQASLERGGLRLRPFLQQFRLAGSLSLLAFPAFFVLAHAFAPYLRQPIMHVGLLVAQLGSDAWLASLFLSRGAYFEVSALSALLLPGCGPGKLD